MENNKQELKKNLGISTAMATVVGCVIGSGVFLKPQAIYTATEIGRASCRERV